MVLNPWLNRVIQQYTWDYFLDADDVLLVVLVKQLIASTDTRRAAELSNQIYAGGFKIPPMGTN